MFCEAVTFEFVRYHTFFIRHVFAKRYQPQKYEMNGLNDSIRTASLKMRDCVVYADNFIADHSSKVKEKLSQAQLDVLRGHIEPPINAEDSDSAMEDVNRRQNRSN